MQSKKRGRSVTVPQKVDIIEKHMAAMGDHDFANRTLARQIVELYPGVFDHTQKEREIDNVRNMIRTRRRANGIHGDSFERLNPEFKKFQREEMKPSEYYKAFKSKGIKTAKATWELPSKNKKVLVMSDLHIPYHFNPAIEAALDYGFKEGIDAIYLNGDVVDCAKISRWSKDPSTPGMVVEVDVAREFLEFLVSLNVDVYYKLGNHEDRWERYLMDNTPELAGFQGFALGDVLGLQELGIELIDSRQKASFGKLHVVHGHEFGQSIFSPVNPARGLFLRAKSSVLAGHNHQTSEHHENNLKGDATACFSTGCFCDLEPEYRPFAYTKWNHGGAIVELDEEGNFTVDNFRVVDGKIR